MLTQNHLAILSGKVPLPGRELLCACQAIQTTRRQL